MTFSEFIQKYEGETVDYDNQFSGQCVDLYRFYCKEVLVIPQSPPALGAADIWESYLKDQLEKVTVPQNGDIILWNKNYGAGYGHVGMYISGDASGFVSFDQNFRWDNKCHKENHTYTNVIGYLRKRGASMHDPVRNTYFQWLSHLIGDGRPYEQNDQEYEKRLLEIVNKILTNRK